MARRDRKAAGGAIVRDRHGGFSVNLGEVNVLRIKIISIMIGIEKEETKGW